MWLGLCGLSVCFVCVLIVVCIGVRVFVFSFGVLFWWWYRFELYGWLGMFGLFVLLVIGCVLRVGG